MVVPQALCSGSRSDRLEKDSLSAITVLLSEGVTISDQGCVRVGEGVARFQAQREIVIWSPCAIEPLPHGFLLARVNEFDCRGTSNVCSVIELALPILTNDPDSNARLHRRSLLRLGLDILRLRAVVSTPG